MTAHLVITEPTEYVDRTLQTASWYDVYTLLPGRYPVEPVSIGYHAVPESERPYYGRIRVDAILHKSYRVNRLFTASSAHTELPERETTVHFAPYWYQVIDGATYGTGCTFEVTA